MTPPTREEYEIWQENPVTRFVMAGLAKLAERQEQVFKEAAWAGHLDPLEHAQCKVRAEAYSDLSALSFEDAMGANGLGEDGKELPE
jgi:hypothetical protein